MDTTGIYQRGERYVDADGMHLGISLGQAVRTLAARPAHHDLSIGEQFRQSVPQAHYIRLDRFFPGRTP